MANKKRKPYEGHISRHGKRWRYKYSIRNQPQHESFLTEADAIDRAVELTRDERKGRAITGRNMRMEKLLDIVPADMRLNGRRSISDTQTRIDLHLKPFFTGIKVTDCKKYIQDYKISRLADDRKPALATINRELGTIQRAFNLAFQQDLLDFQVHIELFEERNTRTETFPAGDYEMFHKYLPPADIAMATDFQREVGWRFFSEVLTLEWNPQIDFDNEVVILAPYSTKDRSNEPRIFPFTARMRTLLKEQLQFVGSLQKKFKKIIPYVFPASTDGEPLYYWYKDKAGITHAKPTWYFTKHWETALKKAQITRKTSHDLRRTAAVERDDAGLSMKDNMLLGGWKTPEMLHRYLQKDTDSIKAAVAKLDQFRTFPKHSQTASSGKRK